MNLDLARQIVSSALDHAARADLAPLTVVVLDAGGHVVAAERQDGASTKRFEVARAKASGAVALGSGSRALMSRAEQQPYFLTTVVHAVGPLVPVPGGVLVRDDEGALVGAVGVSGDTSDHDEDAAVAGIRAAGLVPQPD